MKWKEGQRLFSQTEPELGLGIITEVNTLNGTLEVSFHKSDEIRQYSLRNAPLKLLQPRADEIYQSSAIDSFFDGQFSNFKAYNLRKKGWSLKSSSLNSPCKGLIGVRATPIPHQLYIAQETSRRLYPKVLLADEVGLGKTIEAGLIYSRLKALGRATKVLILCPASLVHQWTAEMFRRFGSLFSIFDEERFLEESSQNKGNAFESQQNIIISMDFLQEKPQHLEQALDISWDLIIVDEAHKLEWDIENPSRSWLITKSLSKTSQGLLLLTATPSLRGTATLFGLLNLLDDAKYSSYERFIDDSLRMSEINVVSKLISKDKRKEAADLLSKYFPSDTTMQSLANKYLRGEKSDLLIKALIDRHGIGRVYYRNRREKIKGFPKRNLISFELKPSQVYVEHLKSIDSENLEDRYLVDYATGRGLKRTFDSNTNDDARFLWLKNFFKSSKVKLLILCSSKDRVEKIARFLDVNYKKPSVRKVAIFHEGMSILERDIQAAWFAKDKGARALICSEIGGEGRNFQFVKTLIFFDLPMHPDLLEQRIGRLDRIGQGKEINIVVPWIKDSPEEVLFKWYHQSLNAFSESWNGAAILLEEFGEQLLQTFAFFFPNHPMFDKRHQYLSKLINDTTSSVKEVRKEMLDNIDTLVDVNSFDQSKGHSFAEQVDEADDDTTTEFFVRDIMDYFGVDYEDYDNEGTLITKAESLSFIEDFPLASKDEEDLILTFNRKTALAREDIRFLSLDHPLVEATIDRILYHNEGIASLCYWDHSNRGKGAIFQVIALLEAKGPKKLNLNHFIPISIKEFIINTKGEQLDISDQISRAEKHFTEIKDPNIFSSIHRLKTSLEAPLKRVQAEAENWATDKKNQAIQKTKEELDKEIERLEFLASLSKNTDRNELEELLKMKSDILKYIKQTTIRIDAIRLILTS